METLRLKPRQPVAADVENWDDDDFLIDGEDMNMRSSNSAAPLPPSSRRESHSSLRSDLESIPAEDERHVHLCDGDEKSTMDAIAIAANAGIPIPKNVPPSALVGGTIKRLGGRKIKKIFQEDWGDDLELPDGGHALHIKPQDSSKFPEALRQVSGGSTQGSPVKLTRPVATEEPKTRSSNPFSGVLNLDRFRDGEDNDDFLGDGLATIKAPRSHQQPKPISLITPPTPQKKERDDDFEQDLELPSDGKLMLSKRKDIPKTPALRTSDDFDWGEGSLGTRFGGTRRDGRSNRSSSASALSPSIASSLTAESENEDEALDGLVLPAGPLNFEQRLNRHRPSRSPERISETKRPTSPHGPSPQPQSAPQREAEKEDFLTGFDLDDGGVFGSGRMMGHRNIKVKNARSASPTRPKTAVSLTFTSKPVSNVSRLPRPLVNHERTHTASSLEPVSESGGPIVHLSRRSQSRLGHSAQSSVSSIPTPSTPSSVQSMPPSTPRRREIVQKTSNVALRNEPTTTSAQLLKLKRSLPVMRQPQSPARPVTTRGHERPLSRSDTTQRPMSGMRPKTPVERGRMSIETASAQSRRAPVPFLPAGSSQQQSHHIASKGSRTFRRHDSDTIVDLRPSSRAVSRSTMRSPSPRKHRGQDGLLNRPRRLRHFGDGNELDGFDDLPTSSQTEARYIRQPTTSGPKLQLRNRIYQNILPDRTATPPPAPYSPARMDSIPSFARDTTSSRLAREAVLAQRAPSGPLAPLTAQRVAQLSMRHDQPTPLVPLYPRSAVRSKKTARKPAQLKPHLIANLNSARESKTINGMFYNPVTMRWEGNENALSAFDAPASSPSTASIPPYLLREKESATPRPALITPIGATTKGPQVVGRMVFDPQNMCWLKVGQAPTGKAGASDLLEGFNSFDSDEDDVFKDIPDLDDNKNKGNSDAAGPSRASDIKDDWLVGEEFDVGPEFIRRLREEEDRWRRKCDKFVRHGETHESRRDARFLLRDLVMSSMSG